MCRNKKFFSNHSTVAISLKCFPLRSSTRFHLVFSKRRLDNGPFSSFDVDREETSFTAMIDSKQKLVRHYLMRQNDAAGIYGDGRYLHSCLERP